jgi:hypothetical protein
LWGREVVAAAPSTLFRRCRPEPTLPTIAWPPAHPPMLDTLASAIAARTLRDK